MMTITPATIAHWLTGDVQRRLKETGIDIDESGLTPEMLVWLLVLVDTGTITGKMAKTYVAEMVAGKHPLQIYADRDDEIVAGTSLVPVIDRVIAAHGKAVQDARDGKPRAAEFLAGQVMAATRGTADPAETKRLLAERIVVEVA